MRRRLIILPPLLVLLVLWAAPVLAEIEERDSNRDGRVDRWIHYQGREVRKVELDGNHDGRVDQVRHYRDGKIWRMERDTNQDGVMDTWDHFKDGKRSRQERAGKANGRLDTVIIFNRQGKVELLRRDTTGDGRFDRITKYLNGQPGEMTWDKNGDGKPDVWVSYRDNRPVLRRSASRMDSRVDQEVEYGPKTRPVASRHDLEPDGVMETTRKYQAGKLVSETRRTPDLKRVRMRTFFREGRPVRREEDTKGDGAMNRLTSFDAKGRPLLVRLDSRGDGRIDREIQFEKGRTKIDRLDGDGDGRFEQTTHYRNGKPHRQEVDAKGIGKPSLIVLFDKEGRKRQVRSASKEDGVINTWQYYRGGQLIRLERKTPGAEAVDLKVHYRKGRRVMAKQDRDRDGHFETSEHFDRPGWSSVTEIHTPKGALVRRVWRRDSKMAAQEWDGDGDGTVDVRETYDLQGRLVKSQEDRGGTGRFNFVFHYAPDGRVIKAGQDRRGKGIDVWFYYQDGLVRRVDEDNNGDGRPDIWEEYDRSEALVKRQRDLDFDGVPDVVDLNESSLAKAEKQ